MAKWIAICQKEGQFWSAKRRTELCPLIASLLEFVSSLRLCLLNYQHTTSTAPDFWRPTQPRCMTDGERSPPPPSPHCFVLANVFIPEGPVAGTPFLSRSLFRLVFQPHPSGPHYRPPSVKASLSSRTGRNNLPPWNTCCSLWTTSPTEPGTTSRATHAGTWELRVLSVLLRHGYSHYHHLLHGNSASHIRCHARDH